MQYKYLHYTDIKDICLLTNIIHGHLSKTSHIKGTPIANNKYKTGASSFSQPNHTTICQLYNYDVT